jgi:hypothetical protein
MEYYTRFRSLLGPTCNTPNGTEQATFLRSFVLPNGSSSMYNVQQTSNNRRLLEETLLLSLCRIILYCSRATHIFLYNSLNLKERLCWRRAAGVVSFFIIILPSHDDEQNGDSTSDETDRLLGKA